MSDTPRTDSYVKALIDQNRGAESLEHFSKALERELNLVKEDREELLGTVDALEDEVKMLKETIRDQEDHIRELQSMRRYTHGYTAEP